MPGPLSRTQISSGSADRFGARRRAQAHAWAIRGCERYLALNAIFSNGFSGILHQIEEHLDELIARSKHIRQRGIIGLDKADMAREPGLSQTLDVVQHGVNVEAFPLRRRGDGEGLHPVDEFYDPIGFVADQPRQRPILVACARLQQLGGAANAGERVFDLMRQHEPERAD